MGSFYFIIAVVVIQAIVGAVAKAKDKKNKAIAAARILNEQEATSSSRVPPPPPGREPESEILDSRSDAEKMAEAMVSLVTGATTTEALGSSGRKKLDLKDLRNRRIEALRRRQAASSPPPPVAQAQVQAQPRPTPPPAPMIAGPAAMSTADPVPQVRRPEPRRKVVKRSEGKFSRPNSTPYRRADDDGSGTCQASELRNRLQTPRGFREAFIMAELLQPPVSMRPPSSKG